jgi:biotin synthase
LTPDEILCTARKIYERGVRTIFLQSGQDSYFDTDIISYLVYSIKNQFDVAVTLSIGERGFDEYKSWKIAGADRYFLKHETANQDLYKEYHSRSKFEDRINQLKYLKHIGYQAGTGCIIGLPGQKLQDIADDIILSRDLNVDMLSIGPFIPAKFTPYQNYPHGEVLLTLKTIAAARIVLKDIHITSTASLDILDKFGREKGLKAGANIILNNFTPYPYHDMYQVYTKNSVLENDPFSNHEMIKARIESTGSKCW